MAEAIAIVGQACVLPGALDAATFANNVFGGVDAVAARPPRISSDGGAHPGVDTRWGVAIDDAIGEGADRAVSAAGGYVDGFERAFDPDRLHHIVGRIVQTGGIGK